MSKYAALTRHLAARREARVAMSFADLERVLGFPLPRSARQHRPWWANSGHGHVQANGWLDAGSESKDVDLNGERLEFERRSQPKSTATAGPNTGPGLAEAGVPYADEGGATARRRHPLIGCMRGTITIPPDHDLTEPTAPEWPDQLLEKFDRLLGGKS